MVALRRSLVRALPVIILLASISCSGSSGGHGAGPDTEPPTFAGATTAFSITDTMIIVQWSAASDDRSPASLIFYNVYMATTQGGEDFLTPNVTTAPGDLQATISGLLPSTTYYFVVRAVDSSGNEDFNIVERSATTPALPDTQAPIFAGATGATATSESTIVVSWSPATDDLTPSTLITYNAYAATVSGAQNFSTPDATSVPGAVSVVVGGLLDSTTYFIVVRAVDAVGNEDTNTVQVSDMTFIPDTVPPVFSGLQSASPRDSVRVDLSWISATDNRAQPSEIVYNVYVATSPGAQNFSSPNATTLPGATQYTVTGLTPNTDYYFVVRARDPAGNEEGNIVERMATTLVSFAGQILQIFTGNCTVMNCHGQTNPVLGLDLTNYSSIFNTAINIQSQQVTAGFMDRIEPSDSLQSYLQHKIDGTHLAVGGSGLQMPRGASPLPQASRDLIRAWINQGALDN